MRTSSSGASLEAHVLKMPTSSRLASIVTRRACSEASTRCASAGDTSVTMSISPSRSQTASSACCGVRSLRKTTRSRRAVRGVLWSRFASSTTRAARSSAVIRFVATNSGRTRWMAIRVSIVE
jgi:hypothetical protein